jgi:hypothetical protein
MAFSELLAASFTLYLNKEGHWLCRDEFLKF